MAKMKKMLSVFTILIFCLLCISCQSESNHSESNHSVKPFKIVLEKADIINEPKQIFENNKLVAEIGTTKRIDLTISITNEQNVAYDNTKYKVAFNEEAKKFIASGVLEKESDPFYVVPKGSEANGMSNGLIEVTGFVDNWSPQITTDEDLKDYFNLEFGDIYEHIKSYTVTITWNGGQQEEILSIVLNDKTKN